MNAHYSVAFYFMIELEGGLISDIDLYTAEFFPDRSDVQCLHRWQKVLHPELVKGPWTQEVGNRLLPLFTSFAFELEMFFVARIVT